MHVTPCRIYCYEGCHELFFGLLAKFYLWYTKCQQPLEEQATTLYSFKDGPEVFCKQKTSDVRAAANSVLKVSDFSLCWHLWTFEFSKLEVNFLKVVWFCKRKFCSCSRSFGKSLRCSWHIAINYISLKRKVKLIQVIDKKKEAVRYLWRI